MRMAINSLPISTMQFSSLNTVPHGDGISGRDGGQPAVAAPLLSPSSPFGAFAPDEPDIEQSGPPRSQLARIAGSSESLIAYSFCCRQKSPYVLLSSHCASRIS